MKKAIVSFVFLCVLVYAEVDIYKTEGDSYSILAIEKNQDGKALTATLFGGSVDLDSATPATCVLKYQLKVIRNGFSGILVDFSTDITSYSNMNGEALFEINKDEIIVTAGDLDMCSMHTNFNANYKAVIKQSDYQAEFKNLAELNHYNALKDFALGKIEIAIKNLEPYMEEAIKRGYYFPEIYNDYGFFLQRNRETNKALKYLNIVKERSPKRIILYLNLADLYWDIGDKKQAKSYYRHYIKLIEKNILPQRVLIRSHLF